MNKPGITIPHRLTALVALLAFIFNLAPLQAALSQTRRSLIFSQNDDTLGRRVGRTLPGGQGESVAYNAAGNVTGRTDFNGTVTSYGYDALNRLLNRTSNHAQAAASNVSFTYTALGQRATMTDGHGTTLCGYDSRNRLVSKACPEGTLGYTYDAAGNLTSITSSNANGVSVVYRHDALNRLSEVQENGSEITRYDYDAVGNLERVRAPNGVAHTYGYNALNRLVGLDVNKGATLLASYGYAQLRSGHRSGAVESFASTGGAAPLNRSVRYSYDALYRLRNETVSASAGPGGSVGYGLDPVGNRISRTSSVAGLASQAFSYDANDRLNTDTYDANGNTRTGRIGMDAAGAETAPQTATDTYDSENRLLTHNGASGPVQIVYDGDGNKVRETIAGQVFSYLVDTQNPTGYAQVLEEQINGSMIRTYTFGHDLLVQDQRAANGAWSAAWYGYDGHGSVRLLTDGVGNVTDRYDYDAFGALIHAEGTTFNRYRYCGEQYDSALGLYYLRARLMNPLTGRFWTADSFEGGQNDPATLHKYLYCSHDPVNGRDPSGYGTVTEIGLVSTVGNVVTKMLAGASWGKASGIFLLNTAVQLRFVAIAVPLAAQLALLANELDDVNPSGAANLRTLAQRILSEVSAGNVLMNILLPTAAAAIKGPIGLVLSLSITVHRINNINTLVSVIIAEAMKGATFTRGQMRFYAYAKLSQKAGWSSLAKIFFNMSDPDEVISTLRDIVVNIKADYLPGARARAAELATQLDEYNMNYYLIEGRNSSEEGERGRLSFRYEGAK